jgi:hypothetical protein
MLSPLRIPALDPNRMMGVVDRQIRRIGMIAALRREGAPDRQCWMFFGQWTSRELMGGLINPEDRLAIISAVGLTDPPLHTRDRLITFVQPASTSAIANGRAVIDENLRILSVAERIMPAGIAIAWKIRVRR